jgi:hypothetical protein
MGIFTRIDNWLSDAEIRDDAEIEMISLGVAVFLAMAVLGFSCYCGGKKYQQEIAEKVSIATSELRTSKLEGKLGDFGLEQGIPLSTKRMYFFVETEKSSHYFRFPNLAPEFRMKSYKDGEVARKVESKRRLRHFSQLELLKINHEWKTQERIGQRIHVEFSIDYGTPLNIEFEDGTKYYATHEYRWDQPINKRYKVTKEKKH